MEPTDQAMQLDDAGHLLRLLDRVNDATMTARRDHDQPAILHVKDRGVLVVVLVRDSFSQQLGGCVVTGVAAEPVRDAELLQRIGQNSFVGTALDLTGRKGMATNNRRAFAQHDRDFARLERAPVQIAEIAESARRAGWQDTAAEVVLAASIKLYVGGQRAAIFVEERDEPAVMIEVAVADDKRIDFPWVSPR